MSKNILHILATMLFIYVLIFLGSILPFKLGFLNPFSKNLNDYDFTDLIYCKFKPDNQFDDRIVIINTGSPDRSEIAQALERINSYHPKAIGVDVIFEGDKDFMSDSTLQSVIDSLPNLILADKLDQLKEEPAPHSCNVRFCKSDNFGFVNFVAKPDHTIRYYSPKEEINGLPVDAFASAIVKLAAKQEYNALTTRQKDVEQIDFRGNIDSYVHLDISQVLFEADLSSTIRDKIVLLGYLGVSESSNSVTDKYYSPMNKKMAMKTLPDMFGVVIHANIISSILDGSFINRASKRVSGLISFLVILLMVIICRYVYYRINPGYHKLIRMFQLLMLFALFTLATVLMYFYNYRLNVAVALAGIALSWDCVKIYEYIFLRRQKLFKPKDNK